MKKLGNVFCSMVFMGSLSYSTLKAEESGVFAGVGFNLHDVSIKGGAESNAIRSIDKDLGFNAIGGFRYFVDRNSGVRFYVNTDMNFVDVDKKTGEVIKGAYRVIGLNTDYMYNVNYAGGVFVGLNIGALRWEKDLYKPDSPSLHYSEPKLQDKLYTAFNAGVRAHFTKYIGAELYAKLPIGKTTVNYYGPKKPEPPKPGEKPETPKPEENMQNAYQGSAILRQNYTVGVRIVLSF